MNTIFAFCSSCYESKEEYLDYKDNALQIKSCNQCSIIVKGRCVLSSAK